MKSKLLWYLAGFLTPVLIFILIGVLKIIPPPDAQLLISKWGITQDSNNLLLISIKDIDNAIVIGVERNPENGYVKEIGITRNLEKRPTWNFAYKARGPSGFPTCYYGSPQSGVVWRDLNVDCVFDQRVDNVKKKMEININGTWVRGTCKDLAEAEKCVKTEDGEFVFDGNNGKWEIIDSND